MKRSTLFTAVICAAFLTQAALAVTYSFTRLSPSGTVSDFNGGGINNAGVVVGESSSQIFTFDHGVYSYYNIFPAQMGGIDGAGNFAYTLNSGSNDLAAMYDVGTHTQTTFSEPNAPQYTFLTGVSENGIAAGYYLTSSFDQVGFIKNGSTFTDVSYPGPHGQIYVWNVNNSGHVVGLSSCCRAGVNFLLAGGIYTSILDPLGSASNGLAYGLNDSDQVVGWYDNGSGGPIHGLLWQSGTSTTFDYPGATQTILHDINDSGVIFGAAHDAGGDFLFIATPQTAPEPATTILIGAGLLAAGAFRRWRR